MEENEITTNKPESSEFGAGLTYCIGLFLAHAERYSRMNNDAIAAGTMHLSAQAPELYFNGASDHLYELDVSKVRSPKLKARILEWQAQVLNWGHGFPKIKATEADVEWANQEAKDILREIDSKMLKVKAIQGDWE